MKTFKTPKYRIVKEKRRNMDGFWYNTEIRRGFIIHWWEIVRCPCPQKSWESASYFESEADARKAIALDIARRYERFSSARDYKEIVKNRQVIDYP